MERVMAVNFFSRRERSWFVISEPGVSTPYTFNTKLYCNIPGGNELSTLTFVGVGVVVVVVVVGGGDEVEVIEVVEVGIEDDSLV
jgi:hypothetical protein